MKNIIVISDTHCGCQFGLFDPVAPFSLDNGAMYFPSPSQVVVWGAWVEFWEEWVPRVTKGEPYAVVHNGDCLDGVHHRSVTQITSNLERQREIAYQVLAPRIKDNPMCQAYYHIRGTEAHVGSSGQDEEEVAKRLEAIPHEETGNYARWDMWATLNNKALCHFTHHIGTTGTSSYESTAVYKEMVEAFNEAGRWLERPPSLVCRCLSEDTELLTRDGWQGINDVSIGNEVLTFDNLTEELQWQETIDKVIKKNEPEMIHITGRGMDIMVTPDHNMLARSAHIKLRSDTGGWFLIKADELSLHPTKRNGSGIEIPISGRYKGKKVDLSNGELWLLGFIMADGTYVRNPRNNKPYAFRLCQNDDAGDFIEGQLKKAGIKKFSRSVNAKSGTSHFDHRDNKWIYTRKNCSSWYIPKEYAQPLFKHLNDDKSLKGHMMDIPKDQFLALLAGFHYGDGEYKQLKLHNTNKKILDQFQELMVKHGYKSNIHYQKHYRTKKGRQKTVWILHYTNKRAVGFGQKTKNEIKKIKYNKKSWCVTVPNHTLVIRRNGCVSIVGNSHRHRQFETRIATETGYGISMVTPGWQLRTPFVFRLASGRAGTPQIGGYLIRAGDEDEIFTRFFVKKLPRSKVVTI